MNDRLGIILMVASMFFFATSDAIIKAGSHATHPGQIILWLGIGCTLGFSAICLIKGQNPLPRSFFHPSVTLRNFGEIIGTTGIITSLSVNSIIVTTSIQQAVPLLVTLGAVVFLNEKVGPRRWGAILAGFGFVMLILRPGFAGFDVNALWAVLGVVGLAIRDLATKNVPDQITSWQLSVFGYVILIPLGLLFCAIGGKPLAPDTAQIPQVLGIIVTSMTAYITITASVRIAALSTVAGFRYSRLIFALFFGLVFFGENPDWQVLVGAVGVIASGLFLLARNQSAKPLSTRKNPR